MGIVGHHPETGIRIDVTRAQQGAPPYRYEGEANTSSSRFKLAATIDSEGGVAIELEEGAPAGLAEQVRLLLRTAWKHAGEDGAPPPRRIVRWRAER
jgi:hypothetical protein